MRDERAPSGDDEVFPAGERAPGEGEPAEDRPTYPAGAESDEGERPGETLEDRQPGLTDDPPRAD